MRHSLKYRLAQFMRSYGYNFAEATRPEIVEMKEEMAKLKNGAINFDIKGYPNGSWVAKSTNVKGIITGGTDLREIDGYLKDATFTYYGVPPQFANDSMLRNTGEPVKSKQNVVIST
ncbi:MAG TPA: hypothetical protein VGA08_01870 [Candidatus Saccharimonadales bacterium]